MAARKGTRPCKKCGRNRAERFFVGPRGHTCATCRRNRSRTATKAVRILDTYGITMEEWQAILDVQGGVCAICKGRRTYALDTDHDHAAEKVVGTRQSVRGLCCRQCNRRLLKAARDNIEILENAIEYLKHPPAHEVIERNEF